MTGRQVTSRLRTVVAMLGATGALVAGGGCGIDDDSEPRDLDPGGRPEFVADTSNLPISTTGSDRIYLVAPDAPDELHHLRPSTRDVGDSARQRLQSLFGPLSVTESSDRLTTAIPEGLELDSAVLNADGTLVVNVTDQLLNLSITTLIDAVAQIVFTASEIVDVQRVELQVDGRTRQWPDSSGELQTEPLTIYDYPGFVESSQPDFPQVPSPEQGS